MTPPHALAVYAEALRPGGSLAVRHSDGSERELPVAQWVRDADRDDATMLDRCLGPTVDLGCGPGRLVAGLVVRRVPALGVDVSPHAVALTRARGGAAVRRDLFAPLPGDGCWDHALLADGNIGIGGDPGALLRRVAGVVRPGGTLVVEVAADAARDWRGAVRLRAAGGRVSAPFPWAEVGEQALEGIAGREWAPVERWRSGGRAFVTLRLG